MILSQRTIKRMKQMREKDPQKWTWNRLATVFGCNSETIRRKLDPEFSAQKNHERRNRNLYAIGGNSRPLTWEELQERKALIPMECRDTTGRLMGDPYPVDPRRKRA